MPIVGLGTYQSMKPSDIASAILDNGYRHIDTAKSYGNEEEVGEALQEVMKKGVKREELYIVTKIMSDDTYKVKEAMEESLKRLQLDYIDMYLIHWPTHYFKPHKTPMHKTWPMMEQLVDEGLTKSIGISNFNLQLMTDMLCYARIRPACNQIELNPFNPQTEFIKFLRDEGVVPVAHTPLAGTYMYDQGSKLFEANEVIKAISKKYEKSES